MKFHRLATLFRKSGKPEPKAAPTCARGQQFRCGSFGLFMIPSKGAQLSRLCGRNKKRRKKKTNNGIIRPGTGRLHMNSGPPLSSQFVKLSLRLCPGTKAFHFNHTKTQIACRTKRGQHLNSFLEFPQPYPIGVPGKKEHLKRLIYARGWLKFFLS